MERKYLRRVPSDIFRANEIMCRYHGMFEQNLRQGRQIRSSLDRGVFRRPHDLLPHEAMGFLGENRHSPSYAYGIEAGDRGLRAQIAALQNHLWKTSYTENSVAMMPGTWAALHFAAEEVLCRFPPLPGKPAIAVIGPTLYWLVIRMLQHSLQVVAYDFVLP